jgi:hypothetical protein
VAESVAGTYNGVLAAVGGTLLNPEDVQTGNYGMRGKKFVYRPVSSRDWDDITERFSGDGAPGELINHGAYQGLSDADFQIAGGDVYVKRALYRNLEFAGTDGVHFSTEAMLGDIATAQRFRTYLENSASIGAANENSAAVITGRAA